MPRPALPKALLIYRDDANREPFTDWLNGLKDKIGQKRIRARLRRLKQGNYGDCETLQEGVYELRLFFGPGYRVYFGEEGNNVVILLCGSDKSNQQKAIETARRYWKEYTNRAKA